MRHESIIGIDAHRYHEGEEPWNRTDKGPMQRCRMKRRTTSYTAVTLAGHATVHFYGHRPAYKASFLFIRAWCAILNKCAAASAADLKRVASNGKIRHAGFAILLSVCGGCTSLNSSLCQSCVPALMLRYAWGRRPVAFEKLQHWPRYSPLLPKQWWPYETVC